MKRSITCASLLSALLLLSCGEAEPDVNYGVEPSFTEEEFYATDADIGGAYVAGDAADQAAADGTSDYLAVMPTPGLIDPALVAEQAATSVDSYFTPPGCASTAVDGTSITYTLDRCSGPLGLRDLSGDLSVTYTSNTADRLVMDISSENLSASGRTLNLDLEATRIPFGVGERQITITSNSSIAGERTILHRDVEFEFTYVPGSGCVLATGHGELQVDDRTLDFTLDDYSRCTEVCPDRGTLTLEDDGQSATLSFDGSNQPDYTTSAQGSGELRLECEP